MKPSSSNAVAGMSVACLGLSAEEESQQPPAGLYSWPRWSLNINIYKSYKHAWCSHLKYGNNHPPLISLLSLLCCSGDVFKGTISLDWGGNKTQSAAAQQERVLLLQMSPNHVAFRITEYNSSAFLLCFCNNLEYSFLSKMLVIKAGDQQEDDTHFKPHWSNQILECVSTGKSVLFPSSSWAF